MIEHRIISAEKFQYRAYYKIDGGDEWLHGHELPHDSVCFRKAHLGEHCAPSAEVAAAKAAVAQREQGEGQEERLEPAQAAARAAAARANADYR